MTSDFNTFAPRSVAPARGRRARRSLSVGRIVRGLRRLGQLLARDWQYQRELTLLMHADDRMLADIGLTRFDVVTAAQQCRGWLGRRDALNAARWDEAVAMSGASRSEALPHAAAPPLVPATPHIMETSNFR